jgi:hypothetical protein
MANLIKFEDCTKIENLPFEEYLKIDCTSFSTIKSIRNGMQRDFKVTDKVTRGKIVDEIQTGNPLLYQHHPMFEECNAISKEIDNFLGKIKPLLKSQNSYTGTLSYDGMTLKIKGRTDFEIGKKILIDLKVTEDAKNIDDCLKLVSFMGYDKQLFNYAGLSSACNPLSKLGLQEQRDSVFIFMYSRKAKKVFPVQLFKTEEEIRKAESWWIDKVLEFGTCESDFFSGEDDNSGLF